MSYRSLLVALDATPANATRTHIAIALAQSFEARLVGLQADPEPALGQDFLQRAHAAALPEVEALAHASAVPEALARQSAGADLLVMSQPDPSLPEYRQRLAELEKLLLASARPVLLIPYTHLEPLQARRVLVAWDGSREAVRALTDALPLLRRANQVTLVHWRPDADAPWPREQLGDLAQWLALQGVRAQVRDEITGLPVGEALLNAASDFGADLIVMGAYGHARWAERLFGGVSRTLLQSMTVPVLMSH